jgi:hypothetical protein
MLRRFQRRDVIIASIILFTGLTGCNTALNPPAKVTSPGPVAAVPAENIISTDIEEGKKEDSYVSIFYSVTGLTKEGGEEITAYLTKENEKDKISGLTIVHRINTAIETVDLNDKNKIRTILTSLQSLKAPDNKDKENINMIIGLLKELI